MGGCHRCCTGVGCSICCIAISIWAIIFFGVLTLLFKSGKAGNMGHVEHDNTVNAQTCLNVVIMYIVLLLYCSIQLYYRKSHPFPPEEDENKTK